MPSYTVIKTTLTGDLKNLKAAWKKAEAFMTSNNYQPAENSNPFEVYVTGAEDNPNPAEWVTELYLPVHVEQMTLESL